MKFVAPTILLLILSLGCKNKPKEISLSEFPTDKNIYHNALDVPVGKIGVVLVVDSLGEFQSNLDVFSSNPSPLNTNLQEVQRLLNLDSLLEVRVAKYLQDHQKNFKFLKDYDQTIGKKLLNGQTSVIDFSKLTYEKDFDDLLIIAMRSGIHYDSLRSIDGKTNIYITIIDWKTHKIKYNEVITGSKYLEANNYPTQTDYLKNLMLESLENTLEIIHRQP